MNRLVLLFLVGLVGMTACEREQKNAGYNEAAQDEKQIRDEIANFHAALQRLYSGARINGDSLMDSYFDHDVYYVTYWGTSEPIDSTKSRLRRALPHMKNYENRLESMNAKVFGDGAYAFFILRQKYELNGHLMDEYLPTTWVMERKEGFWKVTHAQRSADLQTIQQLRQAARAQEEGNK